MKKVIAFFLVFAIASTLTSNIALASGNNEFSQKNIIFVADDPSMVITDYGQDDSIASRSNTVVNLGTNGTSSISWSLAGNQTIRSAYNYITGSGKIILKVTSSPACTVVFYIYDSSDSLVASSSVYVASSGTTSIPFSNLFTNREYYIKAQNTSLSTISLSGIIAAS